VFTAPLALLPQAALGAVLAISALGLVDFKAFGQLARIGRMELVFALVAMGGVIWVGVLEGVFLAIAVTFIYLLGLVARPRHSQMGSIAGRPELVTIDRHPEAQLPPDGVVFIFQASLLFMNAEFFRERALAAVDGSPAARWFVLDASPMPYADSTAVAALLDLRDTLQTRGMHFAIAEGHGRFREVMHRAGVVEALSAQVMHPTTSAAVETMRTLSAQGFQRSTEERLATAT
jgi:SulP family sulfate permease